MDLFRLATARQGQAEISRNLGSTLKSISVQAGLNKLFVWFPDIHNIGWLVGKAECVANDMLIHPL